MLTAAPGSIRPTAAVMAARVDRISVAIASADPLSRAGLAAHLRDQAGIDVVSDTAAESAAVMVVVADDVDEDATRELRELRAAGHERLVLLVAKVDDAGLLAAVEAGVSGVVRRSQATAGHLATAIRAASVGEGTLPPDLLGRLLSQVGRLQRQVLHPRGLTFAGLTEREVAVLRLLADGLDTAEVGRRLFFSERTVKNVIHDITSRLDLRNRTHAVAYAIRQGLI
jgi:DNA-binding NarL/FixJ family response regulator